jgi:hypothetical protein
VIGVYWQGVVIKERYERVLRDVGASIARFRRAAEIRDQHRHVGKRWGRFFAALPNEHDFSLDPGLLAEAIDDISKPFFAPRILY